MTKSQTQAIAAHLESGQSITPMQALRKFGCARLAARILDLRKAGYEIETKKVKRRSRGVTKTFARYVLL